MFTRLRIQNFKAWKDTGDLRLAPLTVFFGTNSSGKSSLLQFLLMLKQTAQSTDRKRVLHFGDRHSLVDLGTFPEMIFRHDPSSVLAFEVHWEPNPEAWGFWGSMSKRLGIEGLDSKHHGIEAAIERESATSDRVVVKHFRYQLKPSSDQRGYGMRRLESGEGYELVHDHSLALRPERPGVLPPPVHFYGFPDAVDTHFQGAGFLDDLAFAFEQQLDLLHHLGPLRSPPERTYSWSGEAPEDVGLEGHQAVAALLAAQERTIVTGTVPSGHRFMALIAEWLVKMGLLESFEVRPIAPNRRDYEVWVKTPTGPEAVNLADVGFGVSQVLPVIVQSFYAEQGSVLMFEQPELHLHPRAQTELADLFAEAIATEEEGEPRRIQLLIESHSEHLLRRLQRRIAEGKLRPEQTALYFCQPGPDGSKIEELKIDEYGRIANWPSNFFGDAVGETESQMEAMLRRMEQEEKNASR